MSSSDAPSSTGKEYVPWSPPPFEWPAERPNRIDGHGVGCEGVNDAHDPSEEALSRFCVLSG